jgi:large subunit ribosomal protein L21
MFAIIKTGGKQYSVSPGDKIKIEKIDKEEGKSVTFDEVLMVEDDKGEVALGDPLVKGAKVKAKVISQKMGDKVKIWKYKSKKRQQTKKGQRKPYTEVEIVDIAKK